jgi:hypothetical protein
MSLVPAFNTRSPEMRVGVKNGGDAVEIIHGLRSASYPSPHEASRR